MLSGRLASVDITPGVNTTIYTGLPGRAQVIFVGITNRNDEDVAIRLALTDVDGVLTDADYLEYDTTIRANGVLERTEISLGGTQAIIGYSDSSNVNFVVWG